MITIKIYDQGKGIDLNDIKKKYLIDFILIDKKTIKIIQV